VQERPLVCVEHLGLDADRDRNGLFEGRGRFRAALVSEWRPLAPSPCWGHSNNTNAKVQGIWSLVCTSPPILTSRHLDIREMSCALFPVAASQGSVHTQHEQYAQFQELVMRNDALHGECTTALHTPDETSGDRGHAWEARQEARQQLDVP
jgi:hypothetical protein